MIKVSVIIPLFNKEMYINRAVDSVLSQTVEDFKLFIIDDGSTDGSIKKIEKIKDLRIQLIRQANQGVSAARNAGIKQVKTDLVAFLDADDEWKPEFLETILRLRVKYPQAGLYATGYEIVMPSGKIILPKFRMIKKTPWEGIVSSYFESALGDQPPITSSSVAVPLRVFDKSGYFSVGEKLGEDLDMWFRVALHYPVAFSNIVASRYHCDAKGQATVREKRLEAFEIERRIEKVLAVGDIPLKDKKLLQEIANARKLVRVSYYMKLGLFNQAKTHLRECHTRLLWKRKIWYLFVMIFPFRIVRAIYNFFLR